MPLAFEENARPMIDAISDEQALCSFLAAVDVKQWSTTDLASMMELLIVKASEIMDDLPDVFEDLGEPGEDPVILSDEDQG